MDGSTSHTRTDTYGVQLENTSHFHLGNAGELAWNYGGEFYEDKFTPTNYGDETDNEVYKPYVTGINPGGKRDMASLFNNLTWDYSDWLTASAGLRYDHYRMNGTSGISNNGAVPGEVGTAYQEFVYDVNDSEGRFSPSFSVGIKPGLDWLQLYASAGRGYRPPTVTEVFTSGRPHGGGSERVFPNPYLKPERSKDYEVGFNIVKDSFLFDGDRLRAKVAYFDTRIDNFVFMNTGTIAPGSTSGLMNLGSLSYVNNLSSTRFRGIDYKLTYDTGRYYGDLTYTHMIGSNNFCEHPAYLGGVTQVDTSVPATKVQTGSITLASGRVVPVYSTEYTYKARDEINNQVTCGNIFGSSAYMPSDRGALTVGSRWFDKTLDIGARLRYSQGQSTDQSEQNDMSLNQAIWPRYKVYDAYLSWWATPQLNLGVLVENLTNEAYLVDMGDNSSLTNLTLARGRTVTGSLEYRF
ncbi:MAG: Heme/hemopexin utilization protein C [Stenotrophomonas maltophilia]|nr:MAG: Heme/hemopexin utilization protein C [Stenotrophomonas maltophilia]